jgi:hypothetical protein
MEDVKWTLQLYLKCNHYLVNVRYSRRSQLVRYVSTDAIHYVPFFRLEKVCLLESENKPRVNRQHP